MTTENLAAVWLIGGVVYAFINGQIRKIDTDGDWLLPIGWVTLWPIMMPAAIFAKILDWVKAK